jgi:hypothetical protein
MLLIQKVMDLLQFPATDVQDVRVFEAVPSLKVIITLISER